jgi:hypothetical protein
MVLDVWFVLRSRTDPVADCLEAVFLVKGTGTEVFLKCIQTQPRGRAFAGFLQQSSPHATPLLLHGNIELVNAVCLEGNEAGKSSRYLCQPYHALYRHDVSKIRSILR